MTCLLSRKEELTKRVSFHFSKHKCCAYSTAALAHPTHFGRPLLYDTALMTLFHAFCALNRPLKNIRRIFLRRLPMDNGPLLQTPGTFSLYHNFELTLGEEVFMNLPINSVGDRRRTTS